MSEINKSGNFQATEEIVRILENSKIKSEQSLDSLPGLFVIAAKDGTILRSNRVFENIFGLGQENSSNNFLEFLCEPHKSQFTEILEHHSENVSRSLDFEIEMETPEFGKMSFFVTMNLWSLSSRARFPNAFFTLIGRDVTEIKRANEKFLALKRELEGAQQVQQIMLPPQDLNNENLEIKCRFQPAAECGGDLLFYKELPDSLRIWSGDVTGHGVGPAMISGAMRAAISMQSRVSTMDLEQSLIDLHKTLQDVGRKKYWMTFQICDFDLKNKQLNLVTAGHPCVYKLTNFSSKETRSWKDFEPLSHSPSHCLGSRDQLVWDQHSEGLEEDSLYLGFTDGLFEALDSRGRIFGYRRIFSSLLKSFQETQDLHVAVEYLFMALNNFTGHAPIEDDITIWMLHYKKA